MRDVVPGGDRRGARADRARFVAAYCDSELARRDRGARRAPGPSGRSRSSTTACCCTAGSTCSGATAARALVARLQDERRSASATPEEIVEADYRLQRLVYALACFRAGADEVEVVYAFLERPDAVVSTTFTRAELPALEAELSAAIARIDAGEFVPTPSEFTCSGCPALDVVCAGPNLRQSPGRLVAAVDGAPKFDAALVVDDRRARRSRALPDDLRTSSCPTVARVVVPALELAVPIPLAVTTPTGASTSPARAARRR